jgi:hypothetical protein
VTTPNALPEVRSYWRVAGGVVLIFLMSASTGVLIGATLAWAWLWIEIGWRAMRWLLGVG